VDSSFYYYYYFFEILKNGEEDVVGHQTFGHYWRWEEASYLLEKIDYPYFLNFLVCENSSREEFEKEENSMVVGVVAVALASYFLIEKGAWEEEEVVGQSDDDGGDSGGGGDVEKEKRRRRWVEEVDFGDVVKLDWEAEDKAVAIVVEEKEGEGGDVREEMGLEKHVAYFSSYWLNYSTFEAVEEEKGVGACEIEKLENLFDIVPVAFFVVESFFSYNAYKLFSIFSSVVC